MINTWIIGGVILFVFLVVAAFTKNKTGSSILFALGVILFFLCVLGGCDEIFHGFSHIE
jgi:hypothetical protein